MTENITPTEHIHLEFAWSPEHIAKIIALSQEGGDKFHAGNLTETETPNNHMVLIKRGDQVVGYYRYAVKFQGTPEEYMSDRGMVIDKKYRGQGIGKTALTLFVNIFAQHRSMKCVVHPENAPSLAMMKSVGFKQTGRIEDFKGTGQPRLSFTFQQGNQIGLQEA